MGVRSLGDANRSRYDHDAPALVLGADILSRGELYAAIDRCSHDLSGADIPTDVVVALHARKSSATIATIAALVERGNGVLLLPNGIGTDLAATLLQTAGAGYEIVADDTELGVEKHPHVSRGRPAELILPTSGSTGRPKLVPLTFDAVDRFLTWSSEFFGIAAGSRVWSYAPLNFDLSLLEVWSTLAAGGTVVAPAESELGDGAALAARLSAGQPDILQAVPFFFRLALPHLHEPVDATAHVVVTGESFDAGLLDQIRVAFPRALVHNVYGSTETNDSLMHTFGPAANTSGGIPIGRSINGARAILIAEDGTVVKGAGEGELASSTPFQTAGYLGANGDGRFANLDVADPDRVYYRTGDVVRRDENGVYYLLARAQHLIKVRGVRTNVLDVEETIASAPGVDEAAVLVVPDATEGHAMHAVVVSASRLDPIALRAYVAGRLPRTSLPGTFAFTHTPLPKTGNGKVDRNQLRRELAPL